MTEVGVVKVGVHGAGGARRAWSMGWRCTGSRPEPVRPRLRAF